MKFTKPEKSWILYDVANSAYILLVTSVIPVYFHALTAAEGISADRSTGIWGILTSISVIFLAVASPVLGAIADLKGRKMKLFVSFLFIGLLGCLGLIISDKWLGFGILFVISRIGYSACNVFYDSMLVDVTSDERMNALSTHGYAWGYVGSTIPFIAGILFISFGESFGISSALAVKIAMGITLVWWAILSVPLIRNVKQTYFIEPTDKIVSQTFRNVGHTFVKILKNRKMLLYILAYFFYIDGVYTIISMATSYGTTVGIDSMQMILALLLTQFVAFPFAILASKYADRIGTLKVIQFFILVYIGCCVFGYFLNYAWQFWILAVMVGLAQGGIQALSRSYFGRLVPKEASNEFFGFFDIFGKFADFMGPIILAVFSFFGVPQFGVLSLAILFIIGFILLGKLRRMTGE